MGRVLLVSTLDEGNTPSRFSAMSWPRAEFDLDAYERKVSDGSCFICDLTRSDPPSDEIVYRTESHIAFLNRFPTLEGYVLLAPVEHREQVIRDYSLDEYLELQVALFKLGRAISEVVDTERLYVLSLGSQQGNRHVHWHLAALPPGVPVSSQQFSALMPEKAGYLMIPPEERLRFAARIRQVLKEPGP